MTTINGRQKLAIVALAIATALALAPRAAGGRIDEHVAPGGSRPVAGLHPAP